MAKTFGSLKSNRLDMLDKLTMGKFAGCRICDIIADDFEYLIWLNKQGFVNFTTEIDSYGETIIKANAYGKSISLGIESQEGDSRILTNQITNTY